MPYIIDGHNLIPKVPGISLKSMDDETQLIDLLIEFCRRQRKQAEVFFDNAPAGHLRQVSHGAVIARFVRAGMPADLAIKDRLERLGKMARNYTVVSSDVAVQGYARQYRAHYISSDSFATQLAEELKNRPLEPGKNPDMKLTSEEVADWMELFKKGKKP